MLYSKILLLASSVVLFLPAYGQSSKPHDATITRSMGRVLILAEPSDKATGTPPRVLFQGKYFSERKAKVGDTLKPGEVIQTGKGSRARLIYPNGDQITVSASSEYLVKVGGDKEESKVEVSLLMGQMRSVIDQEGPRTGMTVRTRTMSMGVRGTDFFVTALGKEGTSEVSVVRGSVIVDAPGTKEKGIIIPAGYSAKVDAIKKSDSKKVASTAPTTPEVSVTQLSKDQLLAIESMSTVERQPNQVALASTTSSTVDNLEAKAVQTTMKDIEKNDPNLFARLKNKKGGFEDVDEIKKESIDELIKKAPKKPVLKTPRKDAYDKYYRIDE